VGVYTRGRWVWDDLQVDWAFSDRTQGESSGAYAQANLGLHVGDDPACVVANRAALAAMVEVGEDRLVTMKQVHGCQVVNVEQAFRAPPTADAVWTGETELGLVTQVADCVPILLAAPTGQVAAIHAGWRGVVVGVVDEAMRALAQDGVTPDQVRAVIGPSICAGCYEVGADVAEQMAEVADASTARTRLGSISVDVSAGVVQQLSRWNVQARVVSGCTFEDPTLFSYRRDGVTGRQAGVIVRRSR
jgi:polyphenol oxidase